MVSAHIRFCELAVGKMDVCESPLLQICSHTVYHIVETLAVEKFG